MKTRLFTLASLASVGIASGQTVIDITGSTAGRGAAHAGILATLTGVTYAYDSTGGASAANRAIYHGTLGGNQYIVRTYWAGSVNGVRDVAQQIQQSEFFDKTVLGSSGGQNINPAAPKAPASAETAPEVGFSDVFQTSTPFTSPALVVEDEVGIIPFKWYRNEGSSAGLTNMTQLLGRAIYGSLGELPLSIFTGNPADSATTVYCTGRDPDSGSRITTMAELGYGVFNQLNQYTFTSTASDGSGSITGLNFSGDSGYASGGNYSRAVLGSTWSGGVVISYLGATDWANAEGAGAVPLTWNGVAYSVQGVQQGNYTFWGYLHQNRMNLSGNALVFYNALKAAMIANPGSVLVRDDANMKVQRDGDGAPVFPK